jgi:hypothetical protein
VIDVHLEGRREGSNETAQYTSGTIERLRKSFYIDNCVTRLENVRELCLFIKEATLVFAEAKFDLREWENGGE